MKKIAVLLFILFLIPFTSFGYTSSGKPEANSGFISGIAALNDISSFGGIVIKNITVADMQKAGFELADMVSVHIANQKIELPIVANFKGAVAGSMMLVMPANPRRNISLEGSYSDFAKANKIAKPIIGEDGTISKWVPEKGVKFPLHITITISKKQGYKDEYKNFELIRTYKRSDYPNLNDKEFANFREIKTPKMANGRLYRASSPIDTKLSRNYYVDRFAKEAGVKTFFNLCNSAKAARELPAFARSYYATQRVFYLPLNVDVTSDVFSNGMKEIAKAMLNKKVFPCLIHCVEGQDRTGFACAMFELFMGASYEEVEADYVKTFMNYYKVKEGTEQYKSIAKNIYVNLDRAFKERIKDYEGFDKNKTQELAKKYFKSLGLNDEQLNQLWDNLSK